MSWLMRTFTRRRYNEEQAQADAEVDVRLGKVLGQVDLLLAEAEDDFRQLELANDKVRQARNELRQVMSERGVTRGEGSKG